MKTSARPTHLVKIFRCKPTHLGFCDALVLEAGNMWLDPVRSGRNLVRRHPWPPVIIADLVLSKNLEGKIANSNLELYPLVLHKATLLTAVLTALMAVPRFGLYNTPNVSWSTCEALTINLVVADLRRIRTLHPRKCFLNLSVFNHPGQEICMADDASRLLHFSDN